jgi:hypothetical protein
MQRIRVIHWFTTCVAVLDFLTPAAAVKMIRLFIIISNNRDFDELKKFTLI